MHIGSSADHEPAGYGVRTGPVKLVTGASR